jgi:hypothetical protein
LLRYGDQSSESAEAESALAEAALALGADGAEALLGADALLGAEALLGALGALAADGADAALAALAADATLAEAAFIDAALATDGWPSALAVSPAVVTPSPVGSSRSSSTASSPSSASSSRRRIAGSTTSVVGGPSRSLESSTAWTVPGAWLAMRMDPMPLMATTAARDEAMIRFGVIGDSFRGSLVLVTTDSRSTLGAS